MLVLMLWSCASTSPERVETLGVRGTAWGLGVVATGEWVGPVICTCDLFDFLRISLVLCLVWACKLTIDD